MGNLLPKLGIYKSTNSNNNIFITIESLNSDSSSISTFYENLDGEHPIKLQTNDDADNNVIGRYYWVKDIKGQSILRPPVIMNFTATYRPMKTEKTAEWQYCIIETWNGYYNEENTLVLTGTQSFVNNDGLATTKSLGTQHFTLIG